MMFIDWQYWKEVYEGVFLHLPVFAYKPFLLLVMI